MDGARSRALRSTPRNRLASTMVRPPFPGVHARSPRGRRIPHRYPAFPQSARRRNFQSWLNSCAQIATIPMNNVSEASAAASSTKTFNITASSTQEHKRNIVPFLFFGQGQKPANSESGAERNRLVNWLRRAGESPVFGRRNGHRRKPIDEERFWAIHSFEGP